MVAPAWRRSLEQPLKPAAGRPKLFGGDLSGDGAVDPDIVMDEPVAHPGNLPPLDIRQRLAEVLRHPLRRRRGHPSDLFGD